MRIAVIFLLVISIHLPYWLAAQSFAYIDNSQLVPNYKLSDYPDSYNTSIYFPYSHRKMGLDICRLKSDSSVYFFPVNALSKISQTSQISLPIYYAENIESFKIIVTDAEGNCMSTSRKVESDGYQASILSKLVSSKASYNASASVGIRFEVTARNSARASRLVLSDLLIGSNTDSRVVSPLPLFKNLFPYNDKYSSPTLHPAFSNASSKTEMFSLEYCKSPVSLSFDTAAINNSKMLYLVLRACLQEYPFFDEKKLSRDEVMKELDQIWSADTLDSECQMATKFQLFLKRRLNDGHFRIDLGCGETQKVPGPLRLSFLEGKYKISAVLDSLYNVSIPIGSTVVAVNGKDILKTATELAISVYPPTYFRARKDIVMTDVARTVMSHTEGESAAVEILTPEMERKYIKVIYKNKYPISRALLSPHCEYRYLGPKLSYFKVNSFDELPALKMQSMIDTIKKNDIIIDLRGNGGGDLVYLGDFLSFFVKSDTISMLHGVNKYTSISDSLMYFNANPSRFDPANKMVVLIDGKTACAAEVFIDVLKRYHSRVVIIGADNTSGTMATAFNIKFPSGKFLLTANSPGVFKYHSAYCVEDVGIRPDVKVNLSNTSDLKPYTDKVLRTAIEVITRVELKK